MKTKVVVWAPVILACIAMTGCATRGVRGTWYYQEEAAGADMFLALVNEGAKPVQIKQLLINTPAGAKAITEKCGAGDDGFEMTQGQLIVCHLKPENFKCRVPVNLVLQKQDGSQQTIQIPGAMPTSLPESWTKCCGSHEEASCMTKDPPSPSPKQIQNSEGSR